MDGAPGLILRKLESFRSDSNSRGGLFQFSCQLWISITKNPEMHILCHNCWLTNFQIDCSLELPMLVSG